MKLFRLTALVVLFALEGCAPLAPKGSFAEESAVVLVTVVTGDSNGGSDWLPPGMLTAVFPAVQGSILGKPSIDVISVPTSVGSEFLIDTGEWEKRFKQVAEPAASPTLSNVVFEPRSTRIARVGTFLFDKDNQHNVAGAGFKDVTTGEYLLLVYFDRPCSMQGVMGEQALSAETNIAISRAGLTWLRVTKNGPGASSMYKLSLANGLQKVAFVAQRSGE